MKPARAVVESAAYADGAPGHRLRLVSEPAHGRIRGTVVLAPPFAEEMNKSRRMCARMSRLLAADGWRVVRRDLHGCGDSSGEFGDATWTAWIADLQDELDRAQESLPVWLWCLRAGALLAPALLARHPRTHVLLWQPVLSGAQHLQQFLRLHSGARIVGSAKSATEQARAPSPLQRLRSGQAVEVAGYEINPELVTGMEAAGFEIPQGHAGRIVWLELVSPAGSASPAATLRVERLRARGVDVQLHTLAGPAFWQSLEIEECEDLLDRTQALLRRADAARGDAAADASPSPGHVVPEPAPALDTRHAH